MRIQTGLPALATQHGGDPASFGKHDGGDGFGDGEHTICMVMVSREVAEMHAGRLQQAQDGGHGRCGFRCPREKVPPPEGGHLHRDGVATGATPHQEGQHQVLVVLLEHHHHGVFVPLLLLSLTHDHVCNAAERSANC